MKCSYTFIEMLTHTHTETVTAHTQFCMQICCQVVRNKSARTHTEEQAKQRVEEREWGQRNKARQNVTSIKLAALTAMPTHTQRESGRVREREPCITTVLAIIKVLQHQRF